MVTDFSKQEVRLLLVLTAVQFNHITDFMVIMPLGPLLMRLMAISPSEFSWLVSIYTLCAGISSFLSAFLLDRFERKKCFFFFNSGFAVGTLLCAFATDYHELLLARALTGAFGGMLGAHAFSILGDVLPSERLGAGTGIIMSSFSLASLLGVPFGLYAATTYGWQMPLYGISFMAILAGVMILRWVPQTEGHMRGNQQSSWSFLKSLPKQRNLFLSLALGTTLVIGHFAIAPFLSASLVANAGVEENQLPWIFLAGGVVSIIVSPIIGRWSDRVGVEQALFVMIPLSIFPFILLTNLGKAGFFISILVTTFYYFCISARLVLATTLATGTVTAQHRGSFISLSTSAHHIAGAVATFIAGRIISRGDSGKIDDFHYVGVFSSIATLAAWLIVHLLCQRKRP